MIHLERNDHNEILLTKLYETQSNARKLGNLTDVKSDVI